MKIKNLRKFIKYLPDMYLKEEIKLQAHFIV